VNSSLSVARELILSLGDYMNSPNLLVKKLVEINPSLVDYGRKYFIIVCLCDCFVLCVFICSVIRLVV